LDKRFLRYASGQTDRQTDRQTHEQRRRSQYFTPLPGAKQSIYGSVSYHFITVLTTEQCTIRSRSLVFYISLSVQGSSRDWSGERSRKEGRKEEESACQRDRLPLTYSG